MKSQIFTFLSWLTWEAGAAIVPRQSKPPVPSDFEVVAPNVKPSRIIDLPSAARSGSTRKVLRYGPFTIPAAKDSVGPSHNFGIMGLPQISWKDITKSFNYASKRDYEAAIAVMMGPPFDRNGFSLVRSFKKDGLCSNCTVLSAKSDLVHEDGKRADVSTGVYLHHINVANMGFKPTYNWLDPCPTTFFNKLIGTSIADLIPRKFSSPLQALAIGGVDEAHQWFTSIDGKYLSGHYIDPTDKFLLQFEAINYKKQDQTVYVDLELEWVPGRVGEHSVVLPMTATTCDTFIGFSGNGTAGSFTSRAMKVLLDGTVVAAKGHMHDGGVSVETIVNGKPVCESKAVYGTKLKMDNGKEWTTISKMTDCQEPFDVKNGDMITMKVSYDEINHPRRDSHGEAQEEMGFMFYTFSPKP